MTAAEPDWNMPAQAVTVVRTFAGICTCKEQLEVSITSIVLSFSGMAVENRATRGILISLKY